MLIFPSLMELGSVLSPHALCECPCVKRFLCCLPLSPRRLRATQSRVSDAKPRSNPSVYLGFEARPQPLLLLSRGFKANFHLLAGLRSLSRLLSSGRPLPESLSQREKICIEQQYVLPGQWPVRGGTQAAPAREAAGPRPRRQM